MYQRLFFITGLVVLLSSCVSQLKPQSASQLSNTALIRGTLYIEDERLLIRQCGSSVTTHLSDPQGVLASHWNRQGSMTPSLYVELEASPSPALPWEIAKLWFVSYQPKRCEEEVFGADYIMSGIKGDWFARVKGKSVLLNRHDIFTTLNYTATQYSQTQWKGHISTLNNQSYRLQLNVENRQCRDDKGQWFALSSTLKFNDQTLHGCARKGDGELVFAAGEYTNTLSDDAAFVVINLADDNSAELILDYRNGQPLIVKRGQWSMNKNRVLSLNLAVSDGEPEQSVVLFQLLRDGTISNKGYSDLLGDKGLLLLRTQR